MANLVDYKFWYIIRDDNRFITECGIRFFEGDVTTELEIDLDDVEQEVTRYRRSKRLQGAELPDKARKLDTNGNEAVVYTAADFGEISTDEELDAFAEAELDKFPGKSSISKQK